MTDEQALLSPARIRGFALNEKIWCFFLVDKVKSIEWSEQAFEKLSLEEQTKGALKALVETHKDMTEEYDHDIAGKGKGLIFLLYGPPGSGKTLTAGKSDLVCS
jgi:ATP-dependent 26S proteasome regulatory subunit